MVKCPTVAMQIQYELRRLFYLMNIQTHQNSTPKALLLGASFQLLITLLNRKIFFHFLFPVGYNKGQSACVLQDFIETAVILPKKTVFLLNSRVLNHKMMSFYTYCLVLFP